MMGRDRRCGFESRPRRENLGQFFVIFHRLRRPSGVRRDIEYAFAIYSIWKDVRGCEVLGSRNGIADVDNMSCNAAA